MSVSPSETEAGRCAKAAGAGGCDAMGAVAGADAVGESAGLEEGSAAGVSGSWREHPAARSAKADRRRNRAFFML